MVMVYVPKVPERMMLPVLSVLPVFSWMTNGNVVAPVPPLLVGKVSQSDVVLALQYPWTQYTVTDVLALS